MTQSELTAKHLHAEMGPREEELQHVLFQMEETQPLPRAHQAGCALCLICGYSCQNCSAPTAGACTPATVLVQSNHGEAHRSYALQPVKTWSYWSYWSNHGPTGARPRYRGLTEVCQIFVEGVCRPLWHGTNRHLQARADICEISSRYAIDV